MCILPKIHIFIRDSDRSRSRDRRRPREEEGGYGDSLLGKNLMEAVMKREREVSGGLGLGGAFRKHWVKGA